VIDAGPLNDDYTLDYAYAAHPRIQLPQLFGFVLPDTLTYTASARIK